MTTSGVPNPHIVDVVTHDRRLDAFVLVMIERRPWDGSPSRMAELEAKTNAYLAYALDGPMLEHYPQSRGRPIRIQLDCHNAPDEVAEAFLEMLAGAVRAEGLDFVVNVLPSGEPPV